MSIAVASRSKIIYHAAFWFLPNVSNAKWCRTIREQGRTAVNRSQCWLLYMISKLLGKPVNFKPLLRACPKSTRNSTNDSLGVEFHTRPLLATRGIQRHSRNVFAISATVGEKCLIKLSERYFAIFIQSRFPAKIDKVTTPLILVANFWRATQAASNCRYLFCSSIHDYLYLKGSCILTGTPA